MSTNPTGADKIRRALELQRNVSVLPTPVGATTMSTPSRTTSAPVDHARLRAQRIMLPGHASPVADAFGILRTQVLQLLGKHGYNSLAILSPTSGAGCTLSAINLAVSIADDTDHTALLVDMDLRQPQVGERFGLSVDHGVEQCLQGRGELSEALIQPEGFHKLVLLPAGRPMVNSVELMARDSTRRMTREINARYANRIVLYDLPPLLETADALAFLPCVDAALLVAREGTTRRKDVVRCLQLMRDTPVVGTLLNGSRAPRGR